MPVAHKEALCLMLYQSEQSKRVLDIWNSRDGVTPFTCVIEGELFQHIAFSFDRPSPQHRPRPGYFWRDMRREEAVAFARLRVDRFSPGLSPSERDERVEAVADDLFHGGQAPFLERVPFPLVGDE